MCFFSRSGYRPFISHPVATKSTFRYNSMFNFIPVSFCFLLILGLGLGLGSVIELGIGFGFGIGNLKYLIGGAAGTVDVPVR